MTAVRLELYSDRGLTNRIEVSSTGVFSGRTPDTTYYVVTVGDDRNEATGQIETKRSGVLIVKTLQTPIDPAPIAGGAFAALADMTVSDQGG